jgi:EAL domain-containing protein (putative c-di-GMP-specific phosphodiesterase class I)
VETAQQVAILQSLGCHHAQGYYFSRPLPPQQVLEFMMKQRSVARRA